MSARGGSERRRHARTEHAARAGPRACTQTHYESCFAFRRLLALLLLLHMSTGMAVLLLAATSVLPILVGAPSMDRTAERQPPQRQWSELQALAGGVWAALSAEHATPFLLRGSPIDDWGALGRWTPQYLGEQLDDLHSVRRSAEPRLLFFTVDTWSKELARNDEFWRLVDGGSTELAESELALKTFRWSPPHVLHPAVPAKKVMKAVAGRGKPGAVRPHVYAAVDLYSSKRSAELMARDIAPIDGLVARREDDPARWRANLWVGSPHTTATPHYDSYHNLVVQVFGSKRWRIAPPAGLLEHSIYPLGHPSARQLQNTTTDILARSAAGAHGSPCSRDSDGDVIHGEQCVALPTGYEVVLKQGDVLALPAYWLHEVSATAETDHATEHHNTSSNGSISFNTWQASWAQSTIFGRPDLFFDGASAARTLSSEAHLHAVISAVVSEVLSPSIDSPSTVRGVCESSSEAACVSEFFQKQLRLRWAPLLDLTAKRAAYSCDTLAYWNWNSQRPSIASLKNSPVPSALIAAFRQIVPRAVIPTVLADWAEALCYTFMSSGAGMRDCPFFFSACLT